MHVLTLHHVAVNHAGRAIFEDLNWSIGDRDRIGLVGANGVGKSSLLRVIAGKAPPDSGSVIGVGDLTIGYLPQDIILSSDRTILEETMVLPPALAQIEKQLAIIEGQLGDPAVYGDMDRLTRTLEQQEKLVGEWDRLGGAGYASRVKEILRHLGFSADDLSLPTDSLSGGQKKLVALAKLALESPAILLLDEPDNHLDLRAKRLLEGFIRSYDGSVIIVSHDRYLLDEIATEIAELENGKLALYPGNYSAYATERELRRLRQQQLYVAQQKEIARIEAAIQRFELWASMVVDERHIRQARSRRKMLDRMEANGEIIERVREASRMGLSLQGSRGSTKALEIKKLSMGFETETGDIRWLFFDLDLLVQHGERVGLIGPNGAGKSVLFKLILGEIDPLDGEIVIGPSTEVGTYAQEHQTLTEWRDRTPIELVRDARTGSEGDAVAFLTKFLFTYDQTRQPIRHLSGGERSRLQLARLMIENPNLLLLDEPTNNLDIVSSEVLEAALEDFEGAMLVISHDRYFLDRVVDRVIELDQGTITSFPGGYTDYLAAKEGA